MPEELEESRGGLESLDLDRFRGLARRRYLQFLLPLLSGWALVWAASWILPPRYKSDSLILVQQSSISRDLLAANMGDDVEARMQSITQEILSRTSLLAIINKLNLYSGAPGQPSDNAKVEQMRKDIQIDPVRDPQRQGLSAIKISYVASNPQLAKSVDSEITNLFIDDNSQAGLQASEGATSVIDKQLADATASLADQQAKVKAFEAAHTGALPTQQANNLTILSGLQGQLQSEQDALNTAKQQHAYLLAMIEQERNAQARAAVTGGDGTAASTEITSINQQLATMRAQLADLSSRYTDKYPDVQALRGQIAKTEAIRDSLIAAARRNSEGKSGDGSDSATVRQLQGQLQANQLEIANREATIGQLQTRISDYQSRLNSEPGAEQELSDLVHGYEQSKASYDDLVKKRDQSQLATNMEQMHQGARFTLIDAPSTPNEPDFPNHFKFCAIGIGVGLFLACLVAGLFEFFDDRLHSEREIKSLLPVAVLSEIPEIETPHEQHAAKRMQMVRWATTAVVLSVILAGSLFSYMHR